MMIRKMTFSLPEDLVSRLSRIVPAGERSKYVAQALSEKFSEWDRQLIASCLQANNEPDLQAIEKEFDAIF